MSIIDSAPRSAPDLDSVRRRLGPVGVWNAALGVLPAAQERAAIARIEKLGYPTLWITESAREIFAHAGLALAASERLVIASGIANVWAREPETLARGAETLGEAYEGRFVLGIGIGHAALVPRYEKPLATMRSYLERMHATESAAPRPSLPVPWLVAALRPKMLGLAGRLAHGSHPYFVPVEHTRFARRTLGPDALLAPELAVVLDDDPTRARNTARTHTSRYLQLPNYVNNLRALGFAEEDFAGGGSDRLVDAIVAWGNAEKIASRVAEHHAAGADHVCIQPITAEPGPGLDVLEQLAPVLLAPAK